MKSLGFVCVKVVFILSNLIFFAVARTCSLIFIVLDVLKPLGDKRLIEKELEGFGIRLNKKPPNIHYKMKEKGGINFQAMVKLFSFGDIVPRLHNNFCRFSSNGSDMHLCMLTKFIDNINQPIY